VYTTDQAEFFRTILPKLFKNLANTFIKTKENTVE